MNLIRIWKTRKTKKIFFNKQRFYNFRWQCSHLNIFLKTRKHPKNGQMKVGICIFFAISIHTTHTQTTSLIHLTSSLVPNKASFHLKLPPWERDARIWTCNKCTATQLNEKRGRSINRRQSRLRKLQTINSSVGISQEPKSVPAMREDHSLQ